MDTLLSEILKFLSDFYLNSISFTFFYRYHYQNPPSLLPSYRDVLRCEYVQKQEINEAINENMDNQIEEDIKEINSANTKAINDDGGDINMIADGRQDKDNKLLCVEKLEPEIKRTKCDFICNESNKIENELKDLDLSLIKLLAFQRIQQIIDDHPNIIDKIKKEKKINEIVKETCQKQKRNKIPLPSQLLTKEDIERIAKQFSSPQKEEKSEPETDFHNGDQMDEVKINTNVYHHHQAIVKVENPLYESKIRTRASLTPVTDIMNGNRWYTQFSMEGAVYMRYRTLTIGAGSGNDVDLRRVGHCSQNSKKHAIIFFDDVRSMNIIEFIRRNNHFLSLLDNKKL